MTEQAVETVETYVSVVEDHARSQGDTHAFTFGDEVISFADLNAGSNRAANAMAALGVTKGDRVSYLGRTIHSISRPCLALRNSAP